MLHVQEFKVASLRQAVSAEEWEARVNLAACYRLVAKYDMTDLIYNHITARVPGTRDQFLINPYGLHYSEITASSLYKIDLDGNIVLKPALDYGINVAGYVIHSAIHAARHDVDCVIHTHTRAGMAISAMKCGLLPLNQTALRFYNRIGYHEYEGPAVDPDEKERLVRDLGPHDALILRNHGLLVCGRSAAEAFNLLHWLERACQAQIDAMCGGMDNLVIPNDDVAERTAKLYDPGGRRVFGVLEWDAMLRQLDREDTSYRN
jgi:ribulose-5-phosphate 4-epimerase/fuculose-1-phosphate aldolase